MRKGPSAYKKRDFKREIGRDKENNVRINTAGESMSWGRASGRCEETEEGEEPTKIIIKKVTYENLSFGKITYR